MLFCFVLITSYILVGIVNSAMDTIQFHFHKSIFSDIEWMDPTKSDLNKWKIINGTKVVNFKQPWYYLGLYKVEFKERFIFSSTMLVWLTDPWHFLKWYMFTIIETGMAIVVCKELQIQSLEYIWIPVFGIALKIFRGLPFTLFFDWILIKKKL